MAENAKFVDPVSVEMPARHWVAVMHALNHIITEHLKPKIEEMRAAGIDVKSLPREEITALSGPIIALGNITTAMHAAGQVTDEANEKFGVDKLKEWVRRANEEGLV